MYSYQNKNWNNNVLIKMMTYSKTTEKMTNNQIN